MLYTTSQLLGGFILSYAYVPQILQIMRTKSVGDLNLKSFSLIVFGILFMEIYAINLALSGVGIAFFITNTASLILSGSLVILIWFYKKKESMKERDGETILASK